MKIRKQDISVLLLYYLGYSRVRNLVFRLRHKPITSFVTFHDIPPDCFSYFRANIQFLKQSTNVVSLEDFFNGNLLKTKINVVITFDDGYKSWVTCALPILEDLGLPATFFITSGFVGLSKKQETEFMNSNLFLKGEALKMTKGLNFQDLKMLVNGGFTIGGHTLNHCKLGKLREKALVKYELAEDKMRLEQICGTKIEYFSYPMGDYSNPEINLEEVLKELGYKGAVTTTASGFNYNTSNPYYLHRELTPASMSKRVFKARVYGNYDFITFIKKCGLKILQ